MKRAKKKPRKDPVEVNGYRRRVAHHWKPTGRIGIDRCPHCGLFRRRFWPLPLARKDAGIVTLYRRPNGMRDWSTIRPACWEGYRPRKETKR